MLAACEASEAKSSLVREMNDAETLKYDKLYADIERGIEATREDIKRTKSDLDEARRVRRNRMQYDALAKVKNGVWQGQIVCLEVTEIVCSYFVLRRAMGHPLRYKSRGAASASQYTEHNFSHSEIGNSELSSG